MPGGDKTENNLPSIAETFQISVVDVFLPPQTTNKLYVSSPLGIYGG